MGAARLVRACCCCFAGLAHKIMPGIAAEMDTVPASCAWNRVRGADPPPTVLSGVCEWDERRMPACAWREGPGEMANVCCGSAGVKPWWMVERAIRVLPSSVLPDIPSTDDDVVKMGYMIKQGQVCGWLCSVMHFPLSGFVSCARTGSVMCGAILFELELQHRHASRGNGASSMCGGRSLAVCLEANRHCATMRCRGVHKRMRMCGSFCVFAVSRCLQAVGPPGLEGRICHPEDSNRPVHV